MVVAVEDDVDEVVDKDGRLESEVHGAAPNARDASGCKERCVRSQIATDPADPHTDAITLEDKRDVWTRALTVVGRPSRRAGRHPSSITERAELSPERSAEALETVRCNSAAVDTLYTSVRTCTSAPMKYLDFNGNKASFLSCSAAYL